MFHLLEKNVQGAFHDHIQARYGIDLAIAVEQPKQSDFGELAVPAAFQLAGSGYINIRFDRAAYAQGLLTPAAEETAAASGKIIVEHTNINPNKAAHIGHLRNATLGDTFVRMMRARGQRVEVQNYIDNTGVQVADVVA